MIVCTERHGFSKDSFYKNMLQLLVPCDTLMTIYYTVITFLRIMNLITDCSL